MKTARFDAVVVAQYFQPLHAGHAQVLRQALALAPQVVLLCLGADCARSLQAPWTTAERLAGLTALAGTDAAVTVVPLRDVSYQPERWRQRAANAVAAHCGWRANVAVISDAQAADVLPVAWQRIAPKLPLAACETELARRLLWPEQPSAEIFKGTLTPDQQRAMAAYVAQPECAELREEARYLADYRAAWGAAPYPPVFVTTDALVCWREQLLLVRRGQRPGKGLWALPGGFVDAGETLAAGVRREVEEETGLALDAAACRTVQVFDAPQRSLRGRTITHAFHFELDGDGARPSVRGGDDAELARWFERDSIEPQALFEDHYAILQVLLGLD